MTATSATKTQPRRNQSKLLRRNEGATTTTPLLGGGCKVAPAGNGCRVTSEIKRAHRAPDPALIADELAGQVSRLSEVVPTIRTDLQRF